MLHRLRTHPVGRFALRLMHIFTYRRVGGLSAEGGYWLVFSLPWLALGVVSIIGAIDKVVPASSIDSLQSRLLEVASKWLTPQVVDQYVQPMITEIFDRGSTGISVLSFAIALWSGSRGLQTFIEANMIINGQFHTRGYIAMRALAIGLMVALALILALTAPFVTVGPTRLGSMIALPGWLVTTLFVVVVLALAIVVLTGMLHASLTVRPSLISSVPGAVLIIVGWYIGGLYLSYYMARLFSDASVYGVLAAPIAVMLYAYVMSFTVFVGSAVNAALRGVDAGPESAREPADPDGPVTSPNGPADATAGVR